jgi:capsule polysaccharide export protein KpsE/RkpR
MKENVVFIDYVYIFIKNISKVIGSILFLLVISLLYIFSSSPIYKAECRILPPSQRGSMSAAMLSQLGGLGGLVGLSGGSNTGELLCGVLRGQTVVDKIIDQFDLMTVYEQESCLKMREKVTSDILQATEDVKSGIVTVAVLDEDPERAAQMANAFVDELKNVMQSLAIGEAAQRRLFFEQQVLAAHKTLGDAEDALQRYQEKSGLVAMEPQVEAMLSSIATLRAQVAAKEVELSALRTYARGNNPNLRRAESELAALGSELAKLERQQEQKASDGNTLSSLREAPQLGLEYQRRLRDVKFATAMYELMLRHFEAAKIDESREAMVVQVIDPATPPDYKFKPKRAMIVVFATLLGLCLGMLWALWADYIEAMKKDPEQKQVLEEIKAALSFHKAR